MYEEVKQQLAPILGEFLEAIVGTALEPNTWLENHSLKPIEDIEDFLLEYNIERCPYCDWWFDSMELLNEDDEIVGCEHCRTR